MLLGKFNELYDEQGKALTLEEMGHDVVRVDERWLNWQVNPALIFDLEPELIIVAKMDIGLAGGTEIVRVAKERGIKIVSYMPDLYWGLTRESQIVHHYPLFTCDAIFSPDGGNDEKWKQHNVTHYTLRQGVYDKEIGFGKKIDVPEIVFVGSDNPAFPYRDKLLSWLKSTYGDRFGWYGRRSTREVRNQGLNDLYTSAKVVVGDSVYSPHYWSNRIYETLARGGFMVHPRIEGIEDEFGEHAVFYDYGNFDALKELIDFYLEEDTTEHRKRSMEFIRNNHTYQHRFNKLLCTLGYTQPQKKTETE